VTIGGLGLQPYNRFVVYRPFHLSLPSVPGGDRPFRLTSPRDLSTALTIMTDRESQRITHLQYFSPVRTARGGCAIPHSIRRDEAARGE
jgi:hypothetical protein